MEQVKIKKIHTFVSISLTDRKHQLKEPVGIMRNLFACIRFFMPQQKRSAGDI